MATDPEERAHRAHQEWLGYLQPVGLVVSPPALLNAGAIINSNIIPEHRRFLEFVKEVPIGAEKEPTAIIADLPAFLQGVLGWEARDLVGAPGADSLPDSLEVNLPDYNETLRPTYAVKEPEPEKDAPHPWMMLIQSVANDIDLDHVAAGDDRHWQANPQARFERLLREIRVPIGLLFNGTHLRLVYAPRGETSGYLTFRVQDMREVAGRPIFAALHLLLEAQRLFAMEAKRRLPSLLSESRKYQNHVSTELSKQVLAALYELVRGFQAADEQRKGELLRDILKEEPDQVYAGLLTVLMRLVFVLYAEDRGLISKDAVYVNHYSIKGLFERLRADAGRFPDTMDQRYGAWAQLITLFRMIHDGAGHGDLHLPPRHGYLFNPDRYNFLEGRPWKQDRAKGVIESPPRVPDGTVFRVLEYLLILDGERLSYRTLDVEQIGSVYETMMGFRLEVANGRSIALKPKKAHGAPFTINLEELLDQSADKRAKWLLEKSEQAVAGDALAALKAAKKPEDLVAALDKKIAREATPAIVPKGAMVLQPSDERRRSGSHYTPRSLTEPIVRTTLRPILEQLGAKPTPDQILDLKVCDPAMGSGAFLVEACRQLGDALVSAWHTHNKVPKIPPDEDEILHARRLVAQRCLYGVDKNPMAVDLAKLSLWLATLARDHAFTFLNHALRHGDSLVGLTRKQIAAFHWAENGGGQPVFGQDELAKTIERVTRFRREILEMAEDNPYSVLLKSQKLQEAEGTLQSVRLAGDLVIAAFFGAEKDAARTALAGTYRDQYVDALRRGDVKRLMSVSKIAADLRSRERPIAPFHWEIDFPEVFCRENGGFDAMVGNPPFAGKNTIIGGTPEGYIEWLQQLHDESHGNADLVAHFFRRAFNLLRANGTFGLIATNTIAQGDTRVTGLRWICKNGGAIYCARRRYRWPNIAAVIVSPVHLIKGRYNGTAELDERPTKTITSYLFHDGSNDDPLTLTSNNGKAYQGCILLGAGFTFDDSSKNPNVNSTALMRELTNPKSQDGTHNSKRIFPYIGVEDVNDSPTHATEKYAIDFFDATLDEASQWPKLVEILRSKVKPERANQKRDALRRNWWQYAEKRPGLRAAISGLHRVLVTPQTSKYRLFTFLENGRVFDKQLYVFALTSQKAFGVLQSRVHEIWSLFFGSTFEDRPLYTLSGCFDTFPFPRGLLGNSDTSITLTQLEQIGREYYEFRAALMIKNNEGLTKTYNRFHNPDEASPEILKLRELHAAMDRAVLDVYGWADLKPTHEFLLDYEEDEDDDENGSGRAKKKPWRYRWPDAFRDEVLARLLKLNVEYAEAEKLSGAAAEDAGKKPNGRGGKPSFRRKSKDQGPELF